MHLWILILYQKQIPLWPYIYSGEPNKNRKTVQKFVTRLRMLGRDCDYGDELENHIRDKVIYKCSSETIRRKLLKPGTTLTMTKLLEIAGKEEHIESQMRLVWLAKVDKKRQRFHVWKVSRLKTYAYQKFRV